MTKEGLTIDEKLDLILEEINYLNRNILKDCSCNEGVEE